MITAQDIREKGFEKAVFGGYDMAMVDEFMEEIATDLALLQKENGVLKNKMKILVDKVDEYRGSEEALRNAVFSAQKLGSSIEQEARARAASVLEDANSQAGSILSKAKDQAETIVGEARLEAERLTADAVGRVKAEEIRLEDAQRTSAEFIDRMDQLCRREMEFLQRVGEMDFVVRHRAARQDYNTAPSAAPAAPVFAQAAAPQRASVVQAPSVVQTAVPAATAFSAASVPAQEAEAEPTIVRPAAQPLPTPVIASHAEARTVMHETVKSIEETVAKVMDEPVINVRPGFAAASSLVEDERPTRSFNIITDPEDSVDRSTQFALDEFNK